MDNETFSQPDVAAGAMKDRLQDDVASWSAARAQEAGTTAERMGVLAGTPMGTAMAKPAVKRASRAKVAPVAAQPDPNAKKPPFRMSYDGTTDRDYIAHRISLGAR